MKSHRIIYTNCIFNDSTWFNNITGKIPRDPNLQEEENDDQDEQNNQNNQDDQDDQGNEVRASFPGREPRQVISFTCMPGGQVVFNNK
jgi:hypothetical protein